MAGSDKPDTDDEAALARLQRRIDDLQGRGRRPEPAPPPGPLAGRTDKDGDGKG